MSSREQHFRRLAEVGGQQVGERDRHAARCPDRRGLRTRQPQPAGAGHPAQRLGNRGDDAEVRAGADDDDGAAGPQSAHRRGPAAEPTGRCRCGLVMSLAPIMMTAASGGGPATNIASIWPDRPFDVAPTIALVLSRIRLPDSSARPRAIITPGSSSAVLAAVAGGRRVAEHHQVQVERHAAVPALDRTPAGRVHAVGARRDVPRLRNDASGLCQPVRSGRCGLRHRRSPSMRAWPRPQGRRWTDAMHESSRRPVYVAKFGSYPRGEA